MHFDFPLGRWAFMISATMAFAWNLEDLSPAKELTLFKFATENDLNKWVVYSDSEYGGLSSASFELLKHETTAGQGISRGVFAGYLSEKVTEDNISNLVRSGFSGIRTTPMEGKFDLDPFDTLALRMKGDGRCYVSTLRTESWVAGPLGMDFNTWQAYLLAPKCQWCEIMVPFSNYLPTWKGHVLETKAQMNLARLVGMTLSVTAKGGPVTAVSGPGEFRLELEWIKALRSSDS